MADIIDQSKAFIIDLAERAAKTFVQAFVGAIVLAYGAQAANFQPADTEAYKKLAGAGLVAGLAAVASLITSVVSGLKTNTASLSHTVAQTSIAPPSPTGTNTVTVLPADSTTPSTTTTVETGTQGAAVAVQPPA